MKCGKKSSGKMSKDTKRKSVLTLWKAKDEKLRNEEKKKNWKDMEDCSMVENENEEVGQHVLLAQVFFRALLVFYMLCMPYIPFLL